MLKGIGKIYYGFFLEELNQEIEERQQKINEMIIEGKLKENLNHSIQENLEKNRIGLLGEILFKMFIGGELNNDLTGGFDIITKNGIKIDIKTIKTNKKLNRETLNKYNFYLQFNQIKDDVIYCPIFINENDNEFVVYLNENMLGLNIKSNFNPIFENPPFTKENNKIQNYVIPYLRIYNG